MRRIMAIAVVLLTVSFTARASSPLVAIVGDSLGRDYPDYPCCSPANIQGWGHELPKYFRPELRWRNDAWGGESTTSFLTDGRWANTIAARPQFIIVMLGTNDFQGDLPTGHSTPPDAYRQNLSRMAEEAAGVGADIVFVTPPPMRYPGADGVHLPSPDWVSPWAAAMRDEANADGIPLVDIHDWLLARYSAEGVDAAQAEYGLENPPGTQDRIHWNAYGADQAAQRIVEQLPAVSPELASYLLVQQQTQAAQAPALPLLGAIALVALLGGVSLSAARLRAPGRT